MLDVLRHRQPGLTIILEGIHDPHNVSAILRTADAGGVSRPQDRADIMRVVNPLENDGEPRLTMPENIEHFFSAALGQIGFPCASNPRAAISVPARRLEAKTASAASLIAGARVGREKSVG